MLRLTLGALLGLSVAAPLSAQTFNGSNVGAIPDGGSGNPPNYGQPRDVTFDVSGVAGTVSAIEVRFNAAHSYVGDLRVSLIAPNGKPHLLFARTGATTETGFGSPGNLVSSNAHRFNDSFATNWWTAVGTADTDIPLGSYRTVVSGGAGVTSPAPVTSMTAAFSSTPANGTWILRFEDGASGDVGMVTAAALSMTPDGQTRTVINANDSGAGSLRAAMMAAQGGDLIVFASPFFDTSRSIDLLTALPNISVPLAIRGPGAYLLTVRRDDSAGDMRIFTINAGLSQVTLEGMRVNNGRTQQFSGGIDSDSPLTLSGMHVEGNHGQDAGGVYLSSADGFFINSTFSGNVSASAGGGIRFDGYPNRLRLSHCTVSGNRVNTGGAGVESYSFTGASTIELVSTTVVGNTAAGPGAGVRLIASSSGTSHSMTLRNSIVATNLPNNLERLAGSGQATFTSQGFNLSDNYNGQLTTLPSDLTAAPRLGPLALQGGTTPTHIPLGGSPALDAGNNSGASVDQRGVARTFDIASLTNGGNGADIGAVEAQAIFVSNANSSAAGSLNAAIAAGNSNGAGLDDVLFDSTAFATPQTINLSTALPAISSAMTISGPGADRLTVQRNAATDFRIFTINAGLPIAAFSGMTLSNGQAEFGGGISSTSPLSLTDMHIRSNVDFQGTVGGGLYLAGADGRISNSTFSNGVAPFGGAGIAFFGSGGRVLTVRQTTISNNNNGDALRHVSESGDSTVHVISSTIANNNGGGIFAITQGSGSSARTLVRNSIVANNSPQNFQVQTLGPGPASIESRGFNVTNTASAAFLNQPSDQNSANAGLAPLANNGGPTPTHALLANSDALDAGNAGGTGVNVDQRGSSFLRSVDLSLVNAIDSDGTDVGAFEAQTAPMDRPPLIFANGFESAPPLSAEPGQASAPWHSLDRSPPQERRSAR
jgi:hypothetical protein